MHQNQLTTILLCLLLAAISCKTDSNQQEGADVPYKRVENEVVVHSKAEPDRLNPLLSTSSYSGRVLKFIYAPLVDIDPQEVKLKPVLAKALPSVEKVDYGPYAGNNAYTYEIKEEATWPNGNPVLASDYLFTLKALFNPLVASEPYRNALNFVGDVEIDSDNPRKFTVFMQAQNMNAVYYSGWYVYPEYVYDPDGLMKDVALADLTNPEQAKQLSESNENLAKFADAFNSNQYSREIGSVVGAGAYELTEWESNQRIVLTKKTDWWGEKYAEENNMFKANPDKIIYKIVPEDITAITTLKDEEMDVMGAVPDAQTAELQENEDFLQKYNILQAPTLSTGYLGLNNTSPKLEDKRVRQAIAHAINVEEIMETVKNGAATRSVGPINPARPYFNKSLKAYDYNAEKARALLKEAGWEDTNNDGTVDKMINGEQTELSIQILVAAQAAVIRDIALISQSSAKKAGINFELVTKEFNVIRREHMMTGDYEAYVLSATADIGYYDPYQYWHTASGANVAKFGNAETDALIEELRSTVDEDRRIELYMQFQEIIHDEQPWVFLYTPKQNIVVHKRFDNVVPSLARPGYFENQFKLNLK